MAEVTAVPAVDEEAGLLEFLARFDDADEGGDWGGDKSESEWEGDDEWEDDDDDEDEDDDDWEEDDDDWEEDDEWEEDEAEDADE